MTQFKLKIPVALIIFNRPQLTRQVFEQIRKAKPSRLFIIADGPRAGKSGEDEKCAVTRSIIENIDWDCEVFRNYADENMGCKKRVSTGLDWVFDHNDQAIILEDDCLPDPSFFRYCSDLLDYYRNDLRVTAISGDNFQFGNTKFDHSYYFSIFPHAWGWATWKRVWKHYDVQMKDWPLLRDGDWLYKLITDRRVAQFWRDAFQSVYEGKIDTWDHQWTYTCWKLNGLTALPKVNLISNLGFGSEATHTKRSSRFSRMTTQSLGFPLQHPPSVVQNREADEFTQKQNYSPDMLWKIRKLINKF